MAWRCRSSRSGWSRRFRVAALFVGWWLALVGLSMVVAVFSAATSVLVAALPVVPAVIGSLLPTSFQAFSVIVMTILYESQRLRWMGLATQARSLWKSMKEPYRRIRVTD